MYNKIYKPLSESEYEEIIEHIHEEVEFERNSNSQITDDFVDAYLDQFVNRSYEIYNCLMMSKKKDAICNMSEQIMLSTITFYHEYFAHPENRNDRFENLFNSQVKCMKSVDDSLRKYSNIKVNQHLKHLYEEIEKKMLPQLIPQKRGRKLGSGKYEFVYNDKMYKTIQSCADDYNISKQAMHKRLKKLHII